MPIPGDPAGVEAGADALGRAANDLVAARDDVAGHGRDALSRFVGAVELLAAAQIENQATAIMSGADACRAAAPVLRTYAAELRAAQQAYAAAEATAQGGQARLDGLGSGATAAADAARTAAQGDLTAGQQGMAAAVERERVANQVAAGRIEALAGDVSALQPDHPAPPPPPESDEPGLLSQIGHGVLDVAGLVPVIGEPADGVNALWYLGEGDEFGAAASAAGMVPIVGWGATGAKGVRTAGRIADGASGAARAASRADSSALGRNLEAAGVLRPANTHAHHIVAGNSPAARAARERLDEFEIDVNDPANGVFLPANRGVPNEDGSAVHSTVHTSAYYNEVNQALRGAETREDALDALDMLSQRLRSGWSPR